VTDYGTLTIDTVVIHAMPRVKQAEKAAGMADLSDVPVELSGPGRTYLTDRLRTALLEARPVKEMVAASTPVPGQVRSIVADPAVLVAESRDMADHLYRVQSGRNSAGLLMVMTCTIEGAQAVLLSKIEHEQGVEVVREVTADGKRTFSLNYLDNLIFAETTKVYKIAVFPGATAQPDTPLLGDAADPQNGQGISDFWLHGFLGCEYVERADVLTERFYDGINRAINQVLAASPQQAARVEIGLLAEMNKPTKNIDPRSFLTNYVDPQQRDAFEVVLQQEGVPMRRIPKDTRQITGQITRMKIDTERDATVLVPLDMYEDGSVEVKDGQTGGQARVVIQDRVKRITGASGRKQKPAGDGS
jgi:predicted RNA-binding protein